MPKSKTRKHHHEHRQPANAVKSKRDRSAVPVAVVFFGLLGAGIAYFVTGSSPLWLIAGLILGCIGGYFFGKQLNSSFSKKQ